MKTLERLILLAGFLTMGTLLWKFDPAVVWSQVSSVGLGFLLILPFQILDHMLNAWGWKFAFTREDAPGVPFWKLVKIRIAGDGVNYLTPSGTIAGELIRPGMLGDLKSEEIRNSSVVVAKFTQAIGQALFILLGILFILPERFNVLPGRQRALGVGVALLAMAFLGCVLYLITSREELDGLFSKSSDKVGRVRESMRRYFKRHPGRFVLSTCFFTAGYAWGALEVMLISHFMGLPVPLLTALAIETLSNIIDALMFMVPGKVGTQEAGKAAIFHALGYPASQGFAFGLIRHTRELIWAGGGFLFYAVNRREALRPARLPEALQSEAEPLLRAD